MDLALEGILETVLVGAIASLGGLTILFMFVPGFIRIETIWHLFRFLLYEDQPSPALADTSRSDRLWTPSASSPPPPDEHAYGGRAYGIFVGLVLCASLYGAGIIAESLSNYITSSSRVGSSAAARNLWFFSDPEIRISAFEDIGKATLRTGNTSPEFTEFMADYIACREADLLENEHFSPTCFQLYRRARAFYYEAKNVVYRQPTYFEELNRLQRRIDFTRAISQCLTLLAFLLAFGFVYGTIAEAIYLDPRLRVIQRLREFLLKSSVISRWLVHGTRLAARRSLLMAILIFLFGGVAALAWHNSEEDFDKRVYGYFFASGLSSHQDNANDRGFAAAPKSSYRTFAPNTENPERFEPSAIEALGSTNLLLVANDKGGRSPLSIFSFDETNGLQFQESLDLTMPVADGTRRPYNLEKIESLDVRPTKDGYVVLIATSFERPEKPGNQKIVAVTLNQEHQRVGEVEELNVGDPCRLVSGRGCVIEGLATHTANELFLGVRFEGRGKSRKPVLAILRYERPSESSKEWTGKMLWSGATMSLPRDENNKAKTVAELINPKSRSGTPGFFVGSGISSLEFEFEDNDKNTGVQSLLVLTSVEVEEQPGRANQVRGALWRIPISELNAPRGANWRVDLENDRKFPDTYLVNVFAHKPEGVTVLGNDSMLVVFDDDGRRKSRTYAPETFALDQNQGTFSVIRPLPRIPGHE